jgi:hypothetical protein
MYIMTFSLPIHVDGRFVGIAGADIALHRFERILLSSLIKMENEALIVSEEGRIIAANTANWTVGDMAHQAMNRQETGCRVIELGEAARTGLLFSAPASVNTGRGVSRQPASVGTLKPPYAAWTNYRLTPTPPPKHSKALSGSAEWPLAFLKRAFYFIGHNRKTTPIPCPRGFNCSIQCKHGRLICDCLYHPKRSGNLSIGRLHGRLLTLAQLDGMSLRRDISNSPYQPAYLAVRPCHSPPRSRYQTMPRCLCLI